MPTRTPPGVTRSRRIQVRESCSSTRSTSWGKPLRESRNRVEQNSDPNSGGLESDSAVVTLRIDAGVLSWIDVTGYTRGGSKMQCDEEKSTTALAVLSSGK